MQLLKIMKFYLYQKYKIVIEEVLSLPLFDFSKKIFYNIYVRINNKGEK